MANLGAETGGTAYVTQLSDANDAGNTFGQSTTDLISFYNVTPIAQPSGIDVATALANLGLVASGTVLAGPTNSASSVSSTTPIANYGVTRINSSVAKTYYINSPVAGVEKMLFVDTPSTATITIKLNSTEVASSGNFLAITGSQSTLTSSSASSIGLVVITNTTANTGGAITLVGGSSAEWIIKAVQSTIITFTT